MKSTSVRFSKKDHVLISRAAVSGLKKSEFIVQSAREAATNTILDEVFLIANEDEFNAIEAYLNDKRQNELLERALNKASINPLW